LARQRVSASIGWCSVSRAASATQRRYHPPPRGGAVGYFLSSRSEGITHSVQYFGELCNYIYIQHSNPDFCVILIIKQYHDFPRSYSKTLFSGYQGKSRFRGAEVHLRRYFRKLTVVIALQNYTYTYSFIHFSCSSQLEHRAPFGVSVTTYRIRRTVGLLWTSDQPVTETSTHTGEHNL
jgi:hypothetical protein